MYITNTKQTTPITKFIHTPSLHMCACDPRPKTLIILTNFATKTASELLEGIRLDHMCMGA